MIFSAAFREAAGNINSVFNVLQKLTGLVINREKSSIFFYNCDTAVAREITDILNIQRKSLPIIYLGLPLLSSSTKLADCFPLIDKVRNKVVGWKAKNHTYAGRAELIKSTLSSIHIFGQLASSFPKKCISILESHSRNFFWGIFDPGKHFIPIAWKQICRPVEQGGLGIRSIESSS